MKFRNDLDHAILAPLTGGRFGPFSTHTAHPNVLARLGEIATTMLGSTIRVENPSAFETKTEVVRRLRAEGARVEGKLHALDLATGQLLWKT